MTPGIYQFNFTTHGAWLNSKVPYIRTEDACGFVAIGERGKIIGAVIFDNFLYSSVQITLVIDSLAAIKMGLLDFAAEFAFNMQQKKYVYALVAETNTKSLRLCKRVGFRFQIAIPEGYGENVDLLVLRVTEKELNLSPRKKRVKNYDRSTAE